MKLKYKDTKKKDTKRQSIFGKNKRYSWTRHSKGVKYDGYSDCPDPVSLKKTARSGQSCYYYDLIWMKRVLKDNYSVEDFKKEVRKRVKSHSFREKIISEFLFLQRSRMNEWRLEGE